MVLELGSVCVCVCLRRACKYVGVCVCVSACGVWPRTKHARRHERRRTDGLRLDVWEVYVCVFVCVVVLCVSVLVCLCCVLCVVFCVVLCVLCVECCVLSVVC